MARRISLGGTWQIMGYDKDRPVFGPLPASLPGRALATMQNLGIVKEIENGFGSLQARWVGEMDWVYTTSFRIPEDPYDALSERFTLALRGLTASCTITVNGDSYPAVSDPDRDLDITSSILPAEENLLKLHFSPVSGDRNTVFPYLQSAGLSEIELHSTSGVRIRTFSPSAQRKPGLIRCLVETDSLIGGPVHFRYRVTRGEEMILSTTVTEELSPTRKSFLHELDISGDGPLPWQPGRDGNPFYDVFLSVENGTVRCDSCHLKIGVRDAEAQALPEHLGSLPYLLSVNAQTLPVRGVRIHPSVLSVRSKEAWKSTLFPLRQSGVNLLQLTAPGDESLYSACDEMGLCVWQPIPVHLTETEQKEMILRIRTHASHILWSCETVLAPNGAPADERDPDVYRICALVRKLDPGKPVLPTTPSGPLAEADGDLLGRGLAHDVTGPLLPGKPFWETFLTDDALLRSRVACPSLLPVPLLETIAGGEEMQWPDPDNALHRFRGLTADYFRSLTALCGSGSFVQLSPISRYLQAMFLEHAALNIRRRFPSCAGMILDSGNTVFPSVQSDALTDFDGYPVPALGALRSAWQPLSCGAVSRTGFLIEEDGTVSADICLFADRPDGREFRLTASLYDVGGVLLHEEVYPGQISQPVLELGTFRTVTDQAAVILRLQARHGDTELCRKEYVFIRPVSDAPYALFREIDSASVIAEENDGLVLTNPSGTAAIGVSVSAPAGSYAEPALITLLPFESCRIVIRGREVSPTDCRLEGLNLI